MTITLQLLLIVAFFAAVQLVYYFFVFTRILFVESSSDQSDDRAEGVSVLVCAWNELENLRELLPILDAQDYPHYEVIVLDDRSWDGSREYLEENVNSFRHIRFLRINEEYDYITPKKYALTIGMKQASNPVVLMTDADCRPASADWIRSMVSGLDSTHKIVLGYSPYFQERGLLNWIIRIETFYTALQYFSFAKAGLAYMGVGRNLLYRKELFFEAKGFYTHKNVMGGDDDLFVNQVADSGNVAVNLNPGSFAWSVPKSTWAEWFRQKQRHLGVSKYYRFRNKLMLGLLSFAHVMTWISAAVLTVYFVLTRNVEGLEWLGVLMGVRLLFQLVVLTPANNKLGKTLSFFTLIFLDLTLALYYIIMGFVTLSFRRRKRKVWK